MLCDRVRLACVQCTDMRGGVTVWVPVWIPIQQCVYIHLEPDLVHRPACGAFELVSEILMSGIATARVR